MTSSVEIIQKTDQVLCIKGPLTFQSVLVIRKQGFESIRALSQIKVDLRDVSHTDSAGLVLLLEWLRAAQTLKKTLIFSYVPDQLLALASVSGVEQFFRLNDNG